MFRKRKRKCWHPKILQYSHENVTDLRIIIKKKRDRYTHMDKSETSIIHKLCISDRPLLFWRENEEEQMGYKYKLQLPDARKLSTSCYFFPSFFSSFAGPTDTMSNFPSFFSFFAIAIVSIWPMTVIFWSFRSTAMESIPTNKWLTLKYARILKVWDTSR